MFLAVLTALASASGFAVAMSCQHHASGRTPGAITTTPRAIMFLVSQPLWLLGAAIGFGSLLLHALALRLGALAVVQPVMVSAIVLAVPVRAGLSRRLPRLEEMRAVSLTAGGLAVFLLTAHPAPSRSRPEAGRLLVVVLAAVAVSVVTARLGSRCRDRVPQALFLGAAAGLLFGLTAALLKTVVQEVSDSGLVSLLTSWPLGALICVGVLGTALNQRAYRIAALSVSMPMLSVVEVLLALALGAALFGETPAHDPLALIVQALALACMVTGLWLVTRVPHRPSHA